MQHVDPDRLALLALGERLSGDDEEELTSHLADCPMCQQEVRALRHTAQLAREAVADRDGEDTLRPGEPVWSRIATELQLGGAGAPPAPRAEPRRPDRAPGTGWADAGGPGAARPGDWFPTGPAGPAAPPPWPGAEIRPPAAPRHAVPVGAADTPRRRWARTAVALAAAAAVGVLGTLAAVRPWQDRTASPPPVASPTATLAPVPGGPGGVSGQALVVRGAAGPELRVSAAGLPPLNQGYYEVWVFDGGKKMVAVGVLGPGTTASLPLPSTLDLRTYAVVDISQEKYDGDQTHSQTSVLRGTLTS